MEADAPAVAGFRLGGGSGHSSGWTPTIITRIVEIQQQLFTGFAEIHGTLVVQVRQRASSVAAVYDRRSFPSRGL